MKHREVRTVQVDRMEVRKSGKKRSIEGHAAVFNVESEPIFGMFREVIAPGAFARAIAEKQDVRALWNHDSAKVLGRTKSGTLSLDEDRTGLATVIDTAPTTVGEDALVSIGRGDVDQMSFAFRATREEWVDGGASDGLDLRTIKDLNLFDVSPVTYAAYTDTDVAVRMHKEFRSALPLPQPEPSQPESEPTAPDTVTSEPAPEPEPESSKSVEVAGRRRELLRMEMDIN